MSNGEPALQGKGEILGECPMVSPPFKGKGKY